MSHSKINRPSFSIQLATELDHQLQEVLKFAGRVSSFGEADGFFKVQAVQGSSWTEDLSTGWRHNPPSYFEFVSTGGMVYPVEYIFDELDRDFDEKLALSEAMREADKEAGTNHYHDALLRGDPRLISKYDDINLMHWVIESKSTLVSVDSFYQVGHGFHTRVVSPSFDLAFQRTKELWELESKKPDYEQEKHHPDLDINSYLISQAQEESSVARIVNDIRDRTDDADSLRHLFNPDTLSPIQLWKLYKVVTDIKKDIDTLGNYLGDRLYDPRFMDFEESEEKISRERKAVYREKNPVGTGSYTISFDDFSDEVEFRRQRYDAFKRSIGIEEDE